MTNPPVPHFYPINSLQQAQEVALLIDLETIPRKEALANKKSLIEEFLDSPNRLLFGAKDENGEVMAYGQLIFIRADNDPALANGKDVTHIHNLRVRPDRRRQGIATKLMAVLEDEARRRGNTCATLGVDGDNRGAIKLYEHLGYTLLKEEEGRTPDEKVFYLLKNLSA